MFARAIRTTLSLSSDHRFAFSAMANRVAVNSSTSPDPHCNPNSSMMLGRDQSSTLCVVSKFLGGDQYGFFFTGNWRDRRPTKVQLSESTMGNQQFWFWISLWQIILSSMPLGTPISQADEPTAMRSFTPLPSKAIRSIWYPITKVSLQHSSNLVTRTT